MVNMDEREKVLKQLREVEEFLAGERQRIRWERRLLLFLIGYSILMILAAWWMANG
ncbi:hypothetical protein [Bhargavaea ginsengi]|uniref:hypothetical protein n=1 Tax=Bhargavaea ginsengi TaxID=426757 RepID=UPI003C793BFA